MALIGGFSRPIGRPFIGRPIMSTGLPEHNPTLGLLAWCPVIHRFFLNDKPLSGGTLFPSALSYSPPAPDAIIPVTLS